MRATLHLIVTGALALISAYFISASITRGRPPDYYFLYVGLLAAFLAVLELATRFSRKSQWSDVSWQTRTQASFRKNGYVIMLIGVVLAIYGFFELSNTLVSLLFYSGLVAIAAGRVLFFLSKFMTARSEKWREQLMAARKK